MADNKQSLLHQIYILPRYKKVLLMIAIFLVISGLGYFFDSSAQLNSLKKAKLNEITLTNQLRNTYAQYSIYLNTKKQVEAMQTVYQNQLKKLANQAQMGSLLNSITALGKQFNLKFVYFRPQPEQYFQHFTETPIKIALLGDYHNMAKFLSGIANLNAIITSHDFSIRRENPNKPVLTMHITIKVYHARAADSNKNDQNDQKESS